MNNPLKHEHCCAYQHIVLKMIKIQKNTIFHFIIISLLFLKNNQSCLNTPTQRRAAIPKRLVKLDIHTRNLRYKNFYSGDILQSVCLFF